MAHRQSYNVSDNSKQFMSRRKSETVEVALGFLLGIPAVFIGLGLISRTCNLFFPTPMSSIGCNDSSANFLGIIGLFVAIIGGITLVATIVVVIGRKKESRILAS